MRDHCPPRHSAQGKRSSQLARLLLWNYLQLAQPQVQGYAAPHCSLRLEGLLQWQIQTCLQHLLLLPLGSAAALLLHPLQARVSILDGPGSAWAPHPWPLHAAWALALPAGAWVDGWVDAWAGCAGGAGKGGACAGAGGSGGTGCGLRRSQAFTWPPKHAVNMRFCRNSRSDPGSTCILQEQNARVRGSRDKG